MNSRRAIPVAAVTVWAVVAGGCGGGGDSPPPVATSPPPVVSPPPPPVQPIGSGRANCTNGSAGEFPCSGVSPPQSGSARQDGRNLRQRHLGLVRRADR